METKLKNIDDGFEEGEILSQKSLELQPNSDKSKRDRSHEKSTKKSKR